MKSIVLGQLQIIAAVVPLISEAIGGCCLCMYRTRLGQPILYRARYTGLEILDGISIYNLR